MSTPRILAVGTAVPEHTLSIDECRRLARVVHASHDPEKVDQIIVNSGIASRFFCEPAERVLERRGLGARNDDYIRHSRALAERASIAALEAAGLATSDVDLVITTSCTGISIPSLDAWLMNRLGIRRDARRLPITELGCAAGAAGVARAAELVAGRPGVALVVAVELPSLTFQPDDHSMANLVSSVIFGDGAAAAVVADRPSCAGSEVIASRSVLFPDTLDYMGFDLRDTGFHIVLSPAIPILVRRRFAEEVAPLLDAAGGHARALRYLALHPGGTRILEALANALDVEPSRLDASRSVLARCGNLSSASVLFVYAEALAREAPVAGDLGLLAAFGPGFSAECSLFRWAAAT